jgi:predicted DNA-binding transcriptional regulator AlpA
MATNTTRTDRDTAHIDPLDLERAVDTHEVARLLGLAEITIVQLRLRGEGPRFFRAGRRQVRYRFGDVLAYRDARSVGKRA